MVKNLPVMQETCVRSLGQKDPLAIHSSFLAWRIPWTEEPGRLRSMGWQTAGQHWVTNTFTLTFEDWSSSIAISPVPPLLQRLATSLSNWITSFLKAGVLCSYQVLGIFVKQHVVVIWWFSREVVSNSCNPMDCSPPGSSVHRILQARIL